MRCLLETWVGPSTRKRMAAAKKLYRARVACEFPACETRAAAELTDSLGYTDDPVNSLGVTTDEDSCDSAPAGAKPRPGPPGRGTAPGTSGNANGCDVQAEGAGGQSRPHHQGCRWPSSPPAGSKARAWTPSPRGPTPRGRSSTITSAARKRSTWRCSSTSTPEIRQAENLLDLDHLAPVAAIRRIVEFTFDYYISHEGSSASSWPRTRPRGGTSGSRKRCAR